VAAVGQRVVDGIDHVGALISFRTTHDGALMVGGDTELRQTWVLWFCAWWGTNSCGCSGGW